MQRAFSTSNDKQPIISLTDNDRARNIQTGYMNILAGSMQGIRNSAAHNNLAISSEESWELIVLAKSLSLTSPIDLAMRTPT